MSRNDSVVETAFRNPFHVPIQLNAASFKWDLGFKVGYVSNLTADSSCNTSASYGSISLSTGVSSQLQANWRFLAGETCVLIYALRL